MNGARLVVIFGVNVLSGAPKSGKKRFSDLDLPAGVDVEIKLQ